MATTKFVNMSGEVVGELPTDAIFKASTYTQGFPTGDIVLPDDEQCTKGAFDHIAKYLAIRAANPRDFKIRKPLHIREGNQSLVQNGVPAPIVEWLKTLEWDPVFELLNAAKVMGMEELEDVCCAKIASRLAGWTFQQSEAIFAAAAAKDGEKWHVMTDEEEAALRERNKWAENETEIEMALDAAQRAHENAAALKKEAEAAGGAGAGAAAAGAADDEEEDEDEEGGDNEDEDEDEGE